MSMPQTLCDDLFTMAACVYVSVIFGSAEQAICTCAKGFASEGANDY